MMLGTKFGIWLLILGGEAWYYSASNNTLAEVVLCKASPYSTTILLARLKGNATYFQGSGMVTPRPAIKVHSG